MVKLTQYGVKLAVDIITNDFGKLVSQVCECLLRRGSLTKSNIGKFTQLPSEKVKQCLWVLIQHNCVQSFALEQEGEFEEATSISTYYMAVFDNIIHRLRFPKFLAIVSKELDKECAELLEGLVQHGRLTLTQVLDRAAEYSNQGNNANEDAFRESFYRLVGHRFVEHCPAPEPSVSLPTQEDAPAKRRGAKSDKMVWKGVTVEERALTEAVPMEAERFSISRFAKGDDNAEKDGNGSPSTKVGEKRKHELLEDENNFDITGCDKEPIWRVNFEEFRSRLRKKACIENVRARLGDAAVVLSAMLEASKSTEDIVSLSLDTIFEEVVKIREGCTMTLEHVRTYLGRLGCNATDELYSIDLRNILVHARNEEMESIVLIRYGREAYRMFRLLSRAGYRLDTDTISNETFVEKKDTATVLYKMWKDNYLQMEKVNISTPKPKESALWRVDKKNLQEIVLDELYHAALNLRIRLTYELEKEREIIGLHKDKRVGELGKRHERLRKVNILLVSSLMKLDEAIIIFSELMD
ncbi:hypothetical protein Ancab_009743 [Ancistrocladus abbreviatus]